MSGSCSKQMGFAMKQRWQKRQPAGGSTALGISPSSRIRSLWSVVLGSGTADIVPRQFTVRGDLHDLAQVHHHDPVTDIANHCQIVANEHISQMKLLLQTLKQVQNLRLYGNIQCGNGLIAKNQLWIHRQSPDDANTLPLTA